MAKNKYPESNEPARKEFINRRKESQLLKIAEVMIPNLPFHNYGHVLRVYGAIDELYNESKRQEEKISVEDRHLLASAATLQDIFYDPCRRDNEKRSSKFAEIYLPSLDYSESEVKNVRRLIMATKIPENPKTHAEKLICDANLQHLGTDEFFSMQERLIQELEIYVGIKNSKKGWLEIQLDFLKRHEYYTDVAKKCGYEGKQNNIKQLEESLSLLEPTIS